MGADRFDGIYLFVSLQRLRLQLPDLMEGVIGLAIRKEGPGAYALWDRWATWVYGSQADGAVVANGYAGVKLIDILSDLDTGDIRQAMQGLLAANPQAIPMVVGCYGMHRWIGLSEVLRGVLDHTLAATPEQRSSIWGALAAEDPALGRFLSDMAQRCGENTSGAA